MFIKLALQSLINRKGSVVMTILAMTVSIFVLLGVEHVRHQAKESFTSARLTCDSSDLIPWYTPIDASRAESIKDITTSVNVTASISC